ncbi:RHS repeat-associated core domain-containing protein [Lutibacter sp.]|uniref:RHS repeat-associated core domain-containing protein n=1 Tax=Lutibacter sp. TaxID=1925666 RepID=UPI0025B992AB|nr:RHS repeat-associated core domain-containing protein [Lutibacter sp.]MCF6168393.1 hypothetical protein [Lutibacter sp.]
MRLSYADLDGNGSINPNTEIISENNYYPGGLTHKGYNNVVTSNANGTAEKYKYQGQELEEELGKDTYAYQWRDYDPALMRFNKIDRFAEKYYDQSPYHFSKNNPIYFREIAGDSINVSNLMFKNGKLNAEGLYVLFNTISDLQDITGTSISVNSSGNLVSKDGAKDANGNLSGSSKARSYLNSVISSTKTITMSNDNSKSTQGGGIGNVNINSNQIDGNIQAAKNGGVKELSFGYSMSFLHESLHTATGALAYDPTATAATDIGDPPNTTPNATGPTVNKVNWFRTQLGLSTRSNYFWQQTSTTSPATMQWNVGGSNVNIIKTTMPAADQATRRKATNGFVNFITNFRF